MNHGKKMVAPIVIAVIIIAILMAEGIGIAAIMTLVSGIPVIVKIIMTVIPLILAAVMLGVLISRIKEIKGGEEDDLSQY